MNNINKKIKNDRMNNANIGMRYEDRFGEASAILLVYSNEARNSERTISTRAGLNSNRGGFTFQLVKL